MTFRSFDYQTRIGQAQERLREDTAEAVVLSVGSDLRYLTGYEAMASERLTALVVHADGDPTLYVPLLEAPRVVPGPFAVRSWGEAEDPIDLLAHDLAGAHRVLVGDQMWSGFLLQLQRELPGVDWASACGVLADLRLRKSPEEVAALRRAARAVDVVFARLPRDVRFSGRTEKAVAGDIVEMLVAEGHDRAAFWIVAAGPNSASPHHEPGDRVIEPGDLVICDIGGCITGYHSDSTRTFVVGEPSQTQLEVHSVVEAAARAGRARVGPGVPAQEVDRAARGVIADAGFGDQFIHRTGHGIGLDVHESPYIIEGNERVLEPGMVFSVEPGIYLPGRFGVRIEDIVVVTEDGSETLNQTHRALLSVV